MACQDKPPHHDQQFVHIPTPAMRLKLYILTLVLVGFATFGFICSENKKYVCAAERETSQTATELDLSLPIEGKHNPSYQMSLVLTLTTRSLLLDWKVLDSAPLKGQPGGHGHNLLNGGASRCELNHAQSTGKATRGHLAGFCCPLEKNPKGRIIRFNLTSKRAPLLPCFPPLTLRQQDHGSGPLTEMVPPCRLLKCQGWTGGDNPPAHSSN